MTSPIRSHSLSESHHGVLLNISNNGVLIIGQAGIGKSSLALDYLHHGHSLIADDIVDFKTENKTVIGCCPPLLKDLLHTRELGLMCITKVFGPSAWQPDIQLNYVISLQQSIKPAVEFSMPTAHYNVCEQAFPMLQLDINNPATLHNRIATWLTLQSKRNTAELTLKQRQYAKMKSLN